ncbi:MAG: hypothetical protein WCL14_07160 [Bacteroidota bacterium]
MELIIINKEDSEFFPNDELVMVKTALIIAEKVYVINYNFKDLVFYCNFEKMTLKSVMAYYLDTIKDSTLENKDTLLTEGETMYHELKDLQKFKYKDHLQIVYMNQLEHSLQNLKVQTAERDGKILEEDFKMPLIRFYKDKILDIIIHDPALYAKAKSIVEQLIETFLDDDIIQFFDEYIILSNEALLAHYHVILSKSLFIIPELNSLTYEQLRLVRMEMTNDFKPFYKAVEEMKNEFSKVVFNEENQPFISERTEEILAPYCTMIKDRMENNDYVNQIKNQSDNYAEYELKFCVSTIERVVRFYAESKIITPEEEKEILWNIAVKKPIDTCCFFFYNDSTEKIRMMEKVVDES